ncbi:hypothetical protein ACVGWN_01565, partial [Enterobacter hormaechei]
MGGFFLGGPRGVLVVFLNQTPSPNPKYKIKKIKKKTPPQKKKKYVIMFYFFKKSGGGGGGGGGG